MAAEIRPHEARLARLRNLSTDELIDRLDHMGTVAIVLGDHLADIAELVGLDRDAEDLAIPPRVRQLVNDPRVAEVLAEYRERENQSSPEWPRAAKTPSGT